ncbi:MAG: glycosyltransferase family 39 protein [Chloroflexi bacterium]|nr:glycosyltransferase family 39 protein [Chloroflexota bacterium]
MSKRAWLVFAFVIAIAAFARLYALDILPPGLKYDAASNGMTILGMIYDGARPFFVNAMGAPEPLILYLQTLTVGLFGPSAFALRLVTALAGVLSVAALFGVAYEFTRDQRVAFIAALALAGSLELFNLSRYGIRFIFVTLFELAALYFFARGWRTGSWRAFILGGIVLGLSIYTYLAAIFVPVGLFALWIFALVFDRARWRAHFKPMLALWTIAFVIALPRLAFQIVYPQVALARVNQVNVWQRADLLDVIFPRMIAYAKMFGIEWRDGTFGIPLFDPALFALFVIGVIVCLARWRKIEWVWAAVMIGVMFLPDLLAADEPTLNKVRLIGIFPPAFFFVGAGASALIDFFHARPRTIVATIVATLVVLNVASSLHAYFIARIADSPRNAEYDNFNVSRVEVAEAEWINLQTEPVYLPLNEFARSPVRYLTGARAPRLQSALDANGALVREAQPARASVVLPAFLDHGRSEGKLYVHDPAAYVLITNGVAYLLPPMRAIENELRARAPDHIIREMRGEIAAHAYAVDQNFFRFESAATAPRARFADGIELVGASIGASRIQPGEMILLSLYWRIANKTLTDYTIFAHALDVNDDTVAIADLIPALNAYPTYLWKPDEIIPTHHRIPVPARTRAGKYTLEIGMYDLAQNRLERIDATDNRVIVGAIKIAPRATASFAPSRSQVATFDARIALEGYDLPNARVGEAATLKLYWRARAEMDRDYTVFVHLLDANGQIVAQADHQPQAGNYPTSIWDAGEIIRDEFSINVPHAPGKYTLRIGWYDLQSGARLTLSDGTDFVLLDTALEVAP